MNISLTSEELQAYTSNQLNNFFPDKNVVKLKDYANIADIALDRLNFCFNKIKFNRYNKDGETIFNHLYTDQYLVYLWFLSNTIFKETGNDEVASKLYYLNKALHGFDCMYDTALPEIFMVIHGSGTMLGKASYSNYFLALQGCTIGSQMGKYPVMGEGVALTAHSSIIGDCTIGNKVSISAYTNIYQTNIPDNHIVFRNKSGEIVIKESDKSYSQIYFYMP
jgi:serine O-acetyltransferase